MKTIESVEVSATINRVKISEAFDICQRPDSKRLYLRKFLAGKRVPWVRSLRTEDIETAREIAMVAGRRFLTGENWTPGGVQAPRAGKDTPTLAEYCRAFRGWYARESTAKMYADSLLHVAAKAGLKPDDRITKLTGATVAAFIASRQGREEPDYQSALLVNSSILSRVRCARGCFSVRAREHFAKRFDLPDLTGFLKARLPKKPSRLTRFDPIPSASMAAMVCAAQSFTGEKLRAHLLIRECGLRAGEAVAAHSSWLVQRGQTWFLEVQPEYDGSGEIVWLAKTERSYRSLPIAHELAAIFLQGEGYLAGNGTKNERQEAVSREHSEWLRQFIPKHQTRNRRKPNQTLRRQLGSRLLNECGWSYQEVADFLGHDPRILIDWYAGSTPKAPPMLRPLVPVAKTGEKPA